MRVDGDLGTPFSTCAHLIFWSGVHTGAFRTRPKTLTMRDAPRATSVEGPARCYRWLCDIRPMSQSYCRTPEHCVAAIANCLLTTPTPPPILRKRVPLRVRSMLRDLGATSLYYITEIKVCAGTPADLCFPIGNPPILNSGLHLLRLLYRKLSKFQF